jgi:hypothetical protein
MENALNYGALSEKLGTWSIIEKPSNLELYQKI